jgi:centromeric protein E
VISQAIQFCFDSINVFPEREFLLRVSYLEVYNEQVKDLLNISHGQSAAAAPPIKILFDPKVGTVLAGVKEHVVFNPQQVYQLIRQGEQHRHVGVTDMNAKSSRAHTLFKIIIESKERITAAAMNSNKPSPVRVSTLNLVDLAGSENAKMTNSMGERAREAKHINQSLLTLSTIFIVSRRINSSRATTREPRNTCPTATRNSLVSWNRLWTEMPALRSFAIFLPQESAWKKV